MKENKENDGTESSEKIIKKIKYLKEFGNQTSFHGFRYVSEHSQLTIRRLLWFLLILACFGGLLFQIVDRVAYYYGWPVTVNVVVNYNNTLQFPAVTICNQNAFKASLAAENGWYELIDQMFSSHRTQGIEKYIRNSMYENISLETLYLNTAHEREDFIFRCSWKGIPCKQDDFDKILTDHGVCFSWSSKDNDYVSSPGVENGLKLKLNVEQYEYMPGPHNAAGIKILIHDRLEIPMVHALGQAMSTGANVFTSVQLMKVVNLPSPHGVCSSRELNFIDRYSQGDCKLDCLSHTAAKMCGCRHIYMPSKNGYPPVCTIGQYYSCLKQILDDVPSRYEEDCNCPVPCKSNAYHSEISYASNSKFAGKKFISKNFTEILINKLKDANEVTSRMDGDKFQKFKDLYTNFHTKLSVLEIKLLQDLTSLLSVLKVRLSASFNHLRSVCTWKKWLYRYQEYVVLKNFIRPRDAFEESNIHIISLAFNEYVLTIESNLRSLNSTVFLDTSVREFLYQQTVDKLLNRQEIVRRSQINFAQLGTAYREGVGIFNYTYDYAPRSHNDYAVPVYLLKESLSHNKYAVKFTNRLEYCLNSTYDILTYFKELVDKTYASRNLTEEDIIQGSDDFRSVMGSFSFSKAVTYYEVIERPYRILQQRYLEFEKICFSAETDIHTIEEAVDSLTETIISFNNTYFEPLHLISSVIDRYLSNFDGEKLVIGKQFLSGQMKNCERDLRNLLQLILKDDSDISSELNKVFSSHLEIYKTIVNDRDSFIYYNFSKHYDYLKTFEDVKEIIDSNYTELQAMITLYETVGEDGTAFLQSFTYLKEYFSAYNEMMDINNEFIKENFMQLDLYYKQMSYEEITQQKAYDSFALICDIGGSMGLFLGASLLSWCEILDLFIINFMLPRNRPQ
ncbi:degenerin-like protein del-10 [Mytilus edulis]|uniref:degenerin-like protein del-10 n=1 Tax=Mytilus edulis TaxID=6550 RepID=UPI0039EEB820